MTNSFKNDRCVRLIPIERIDVLNPRERNEDKFFEVSQNIKNIGLKKPITVTPRPGSDGAERYLLVCGEGRLRTFKENNETRIPALVIESSDEEAFLMSLTENIARRRNSPIDRLSGIVALKKSSYSDKQISDKTGLSLGYVRDILRLFDFGEERLVVAVEKKQIPIGVAIGIVAAGPDDRAVQAALLEAYETGELKGRQLIRAKAVIHKRSVLGRTMGRVGSRKPPEVSSSSLIRAYQKEVKRQQLIVKKTAYAQQQLLFVVGALRELYADENFLNLLRAENLDTLPRYLAERISASGAVI